MLCRVLGRQVLEGQPWPCPAVRQRRKPSCFTCSSGRFSREVLWVVHVVFNALYRRRRENKPVDKELLLLLKSAASVSRLYGTRATRPHKRAMRYCGGRGEEGRRWLPPLHRQTSDCCCSCRCKKPSMIATRIHHGSNSRRANTPQENSSATTPCWPTL